MEIRHLHRWEAQHERALVSILDSFVVVCGDGEYIIYTAMALRNKSFGSAQEFVCPQALRL